jgi:methionyl-tRNA formyltransferase
MPQLMRSKYKIIFMGTPDFAVPALRALHNAGHEIACVYTQPPRPAGRGKKLRPSPVQLAAEELGLEVRSPKSLKTAEEQAQLASLDADVAVVAAYGLILPQAVLDAPAKGCLNIHASILPRWRGAAPIHRAVMAGDPVTGVTIMQMEAGLDTGPMLATQRTPIERKTTGELTDELAQIGAHLMAETLRELDKHVPVAQDDEDANYAPKIDKAEARVDWGQPAEDIERLVRGLAPFPGAWFELEGDKGPERVKLLGADIVEQSGEHSGGHSGEPGEVLDDSLTIACAANAIRPTRLQPAGKPAMALDDFLRGRSVPRGSKLS